MPKRVAVIDIGSNSARLVIYQRTSRYGFHLITQKRVELESGEGAYQRGGELQKEGIDRAFKALESFSLIIKEYKVRKIHCVATSALRDAPNRSQFISLVKKRLGLKIRVIDGNKEAFYGAIATINLLPIKDGITVDIGGGSTDIALIQSGKIVETLSIDLGTVRLKELFSDKNIPIDRAKSYIKERVSTLKKFYKVDKVIGIGGTSRALAKLIMKKIEYPFEKIHGFKYRVEEHKNFIEELANYSIEELESIGVKPNRVDTFREGINIFLSVVDEVGAENIISSGVGVREGVFLSDMLRGDKYKFPPNINASVRSIKDRFDILNFPEKNKRKISKKLFEIFKHKFSGEEKDKKILFYALTLSNIGKILTVYKSHQHAFYIASQELNFGFFHKDIILISLLLRSKSDSLYYKPLYKKYKNLLPNKQYIKWLSFIYVLTLTLYENSSQAQIEFKWIENRNVLKISTNKTLYLASEEILLMEKPEEFNIEIEKI